MCQPLETWLSSPAVVLYLKNLTNQSWAYRFLRDFLHSGSTHGGCLCYTHSRRFQLFPSVEVWSYPTHEPSVLPRPLAARVSWAMEGLSTQMRSSVLQWWWRQRLFAQHPWAELHQPPGPYPHPSSVNPGRWLSHSHTRQSRFPDSLRGGREGQSQLHIEAIPFTLTLEFCCLCLKLRELPIAWNAWQSPSSRLWPFRGHSIHAEQGSAPTGPWSMASQERGRAEGVEGREQAKLHLPLHLLPIAHIPLVCEKMVFQETVPCWQKSWGTLIQR